MDTLHPRADWESVGDKWFRKTQLYTAVFDQDLDLDNYIVTGAPYAGAVALWRDETKLLAYQPGRSSKPAIDIYSLAGKKLRSIPWDKGHIKGIGWSEDETLLVVTAEGIVRCYDLQGDFTQFSLGHGADNYSVESCRFYDHGMVALLGNNTLITVSSYTEPRPKPLATVPEGMINSWAIISPNYTLSRSVEVLLSIGETVYVVDATDCEDRFLDFGPFSHISVSPDGRNLNLYAKNGKAHIVSSDFQERLFVHDPDSQTPPQYVEWCGSDALIAWEDEVHIIGPGDISSSYIYDSTRVHVISEHDGAWLITNDFCEFLERVPRETMEVFGPATDSSPASILLDAVGQLELESPKADDYIQLIRPNLTEAVDTCVNAAGCEFDVHLQKRLLKAASFGKSVLDIYNSDEFVDMCETLRVLNAMRFYRELDTYSMGYSLGTTSVASMSSTHSRHRPSRLRNEVPRSPDDNKVNDLFQFTRARLSDIPYKHPMSTDNSRLTNNDLRRQMLSTIFGWNKEIDDLIRDEMSRHPVGSPSRILLAKWLGDINADIMNASSENMTSSDWMLLALSGIGGNASQQKLGRAYIQRLLESGDVHAAVTIMLGMGDHNDAVEIYISHKRYMEALILACLVFPSVWERQCAIIKKWGEWAIQHGQQQLAIRCFACTDQEPTEPWTSPSAIQLNFQNITPSIPEVLSPPLSPPGLQRGPQRSIAKTSALKLITSFGDQTQKSKFFAHGDGGQTPIAAGVTPIADTALSPGGNQEATTAFLRPSNNSRFNTPTSARPVGSNFGRGRLPSIGETPSDLNREQLKQSVLTAKAHVHSRAASTGQDNLANGIALARAATASPMMMRDGYERLVRGPEGELPPSPDKNVMMKMHKVQENHRNGSRDRIPVGVHLQLQPMAPPETMDITSPEQSVTSATRFHWPSRRRGPGSVASSVTSASSAGRGLRQKVARNREDYIHSLDAAQDYSRKQRSRHTSRERSRGRHSSKERSTKSRDVSEDRGRSSSRTWAKPKRSPTSPIPMSPEDLINLSTPKQAEMSEPPTIKKRSESIVRPGSRASSRGGRRRSPDSRPRPPALDIRGRSQGRSGSTHRSPSSPLPMSAIPHHYQGSEDEDDYKAALEAQELFRQKHCRSANRGLNSPQATRGERSQSRRRANSEATDVIGPLPPLVRAGSTEHAGDLRRMKDDRQRKKEQAARELEERRKSLAQRPQAPIILHPNQYSPALPRIGVEAEDPKSLPDHLPPRCATEPPREPPKSMYARNGPAIGLPATPKAMRLILEADHHSETGSTPRPEVPAIPSSFMSQRQSPPRQSPKSSPEPSPKMVQIPPPPPPPPAPQAAPEDEAQDLLTLLPSTVYQPPTRPIPRSMSAPIPDEPGPARFGRKNSLRGSRRIEDMASGGRRRSHEDPVPPPPPLPPAPPVLKELQHLAKPPPPPPAPLPHLARSNTMGAIGSGMIEIVMDDEETSGNDAAPVTHSPPKSSKSSSFKAHARGRSIGDTSLSGRFNKATERLRSASRSRKDHGHMISPPFEAPYESIPMHRHLKSPPPVSYNHETMRSPEFQNKHASTGLHHSEMI